MPQLGESVTEGTIERWLVKEGDKVEQYDPLFEVVTDKVNAEVPAEVAGTVTKIIVGDGQTVKVGTPLAEIDTEGGAAEAAAPTPEPAAAPTPEPAPEPMPEPTPEPAPSRGRSPSKLPLPPLQPRARCRCRSSARARCRRTAATCAGGCRPGKPARHRARDPVSPRHEREHANDPGSSPAGARAWDRRHQGPRKRLRRARHARRRARIHGIWSRRRNCGKSNARCRGRASGAAEPAARRQPRSRPRWRRPLHRRRRPRPHLRRLLRPRLPRPPMQPRRRSPPLPAATWRFPSARCARGSRPR